MPNIIPILIMNAILIVIAVLLLIAEKFLVTYGECKITVEQEEGKKEIAVQGGDYLLSYLTQHGIEVSSSCGGKASCGYCKVKVVNGGGPILPTEEIFMSREEKAGGMRLACQVKVRNDLAIYIPDFLSTVRSMVKNRNYNPQQKWNFRISQQSYNVSTAEVPALPPGDVTKLHSIIKEYKDLPGPLVPVLQKSNDTFNYLSEPVLRYISVNLKTPLSTVLRIATFYNAFSLKPRGKYVITVCLGTACHVKGSADILSTFEKELGIKNGETTEDRLFSLAGVRCIGCCGLAPVLKVNEDVHGLMTKNKVADLINMYRKA